MFSHWPAGKSVGVYILKIICHFCQIYVWWAEWLLVKQTTLGTESFLLSHDAWWACYNEICHVPLYFLQILTESFLESLERWWTLKQCSHDMVVVYNFKLVKSLMQQCWKEYFHGSSVCDLAWNPPVLNVKAMFTWHDCSLQLPVSEISNAAVLERYTLMQINWNKL